MNVLIIDAQGGGIGRQLVAAVRRRLPDAIITAVGADIGHDESGGPPRRDR